MKIFWLYFMALLLLPVAGSMASAADIKEGGDASLNCIATISGTIEPGDAEKLKSFLGNLEDGGSLEINGVNLLSVMDGNQRARLCLDSPGGSLAEAIRMADSLLKDFDGSYWIHSLGTAVPAGATCASACAVFFMAGGENTESDIGRVADRVLHAQGRLGFHSISLTLPDKTYSRDDVGRAFALALKSMGAVAERMNGLRLRLSLLQTMLSTAPDDMYYVQKIGDAAHWNIQVAGLPVVSQPSPANIHEACLKLSRQLTPEDGATPGNYASERSGGAEGAVLAHRIWPQNEIGADSFRSYRTGSGDGGIEFVTDGGSELGDIGCSGVFDPATLKMTAQVSASNGWTLAVPNHFMLPGDMTFQEVLGLGGGEGEIDTATVIARRNATPASTTCLVFSGDAKTDEEPCDQTGVTTLDFGLNAHSTEIYQWPSGGKTVIERTGGKVLINGAAAEELWRKTKPKPVAEVTEADCLKNTSSGNVFCYLQQY